MKRILTLRTITPLHVGTGQSVGTTDLPVARERTTSWPVVPGSSFKGVLKDAARISLLEKGGVAARSKADGDRADRELSYLFGSPVNEEASAGALSVTDLRCVLFPVRSLAGTFCLATCPLALERANELLSIAGEEALFVPKTVGKTQALVCRESSLEHQYDGKKRVYLEDLDLEVGTLDSTEIATRLTGLFGFPSGTVSRHLAVLPNDLFTFLSNTATEVTTHVSLVFETRAARPGFLRSEERVPEETCFVGLAVVDSLHGAGRLSEVRAYVDGFRSDPRHLQFGGKSSVGNGLCRVGAA